jgi:uncharacterized protein (DUF924 family)
MHTTDHAGSRQSLFANRHSQQIIKRVLQFWFGIAGTTSFGNTRSFWFHSTDITDAEITNAFINDYSSAARGELDYLVDSPEGCLALILLLDQMPRNMFRGMQKAFETDDKALAICKHALKKGFDAELPTPAHQFFMYLPLEHSEDIEDQGKAVSYISALGNDQWTHFAELHHQIIARFSRFPGRNAILGRTSSEAECQFLQNEPQFF